MSNREMTGGDFEVVDDEVAVMIGVGSLLWVSERVLLGFKFAWYEILVGAAAPARTPSAPTSSPPHLSPPLLTAVGDAKLGTPLPLSPPPPPHPSFTSLLNAPRPGFLALGGFGLWLDEFGLGLGRGIWAFPGVGGDPNSGAGGRGIGIGSVWQFDSSDHHHLRHHHQHNHGGLVSAATTAGGGAGDFCSWA